MSLVKIEEFGGKREIIKHFSHEHPLVLVSAQNVPRDSKCYGCELLISEPRCYECSSNECQTIFLHKSCANLPREIKHPIHAEHPFTLLAKPPYTKCFCSSCGKFMEGFTFNCSFCKFDLCVECAHLVLQKRRLKHDSHHHFLTSMQRPATFSCDGCDEKKEDWSFSCNICPYWIHRSCAFLPTTKKRDDHEHPLSLAYHLPFDLRLNHFNCDVCRRPLNPSRWFYQCYSCKHFVHVGCVQDGTKPAGAKGSSSSASNQPDHGLDFKPLPWTDMSADLIRPFLEKMGDVEIQLTNQINHFSHEHQLILSVAEVDKDKNEEEMLCDACIEPISTPYYTCSQCNFLLHLNCANIPAKMKAHHDHPEHQLSLRKLENKYGYFYCNFCFLNCNGFFFECEPCNYRIDLHCAFLPRTITHQIHDQHVLNRNIAPMECLCDACGNKFFGDASEKKISGLVRYSCDDCFKLSLHYQCAIMPHTVAHRWDKHCLTLMYPPFGDHPDEFYCEICGEEINPKHWLYHCKECDQSFHLYCIPRLRKDRFMKFGKTLQVSDHQHPLTSIRECRNGSSCNRCSTKLSGGKGFECGKCKFFLCYKCACDVPPEPAVCVIL
ncbi:unnamed protein product [Coffea canephora]|uniref:Phorbol-ester/DAG-type domain-containing protein n=1 Tax=Coffea canephora TaxID=49390 RepID=A0A068V412_COFCA|nr:unnamed protein product [Coffea canephora]